MGNWKVILPEATNSLIVNPSWETSSGNWTASGLSTYSRVSTEHMYGVYSAHIAGTVGTGGRFYSTGMAIAAGETWTFSVHVKKSVSASSDLGAIQINWQTSSEGAISSTSASLDAGSITSWTRYVLTATPATSALYATVEANDGGITSGSTWHMWLDAVQFE